MIKCFEKNLILIIIDTTIVISCVQFYSWWKYAGNVLCTHYFLINTLRVYNTAGNIQENKKMTEQNVNSTRAC